MLRNSQREIIEEIAESIDYETIQKTTSEHLNTDSTDYQILKEIYETRNDAWRVLVSELIEGSCLDLYAGFGRRSLALAEVTDEVYAIEPNILKARIIDNRNDFDSQSSVIPIHADEDSLFFQKESFDTVIADFTGRGSGSWKTRLKEIDSITSNKGSIFVLLDGITRQLGFSKYVGFDSSLPSVSNRVSPLAVKRAKNILDSLDYKCVKTYTLSPVPDQLRLVYKLGDELGASLLTKAAFSTDYTPSFINMFINWSNKMGLLDFFHPSYLIVGTNKTNREENSQTQSVLETGRSRSTLFEFEHGKMSTVLKYPNRKRHSEFNKNEHEIIQYLQNEESHIREYLPKGDLINTKFGAVRKEQPVAGRLLSESQDIVPCERILELGINWLIDFQQPTERKRVTLSPDEFVDKYSVPTMDFNPPQPSKPIEHFQVPVHGDLKPGNMYIDSGEISAVIDWEYGGKSENPIIDAGFFIINAINNGHSPRDTMIELASGSSTLKLAQEVVKTYCEEVGISMYSFLSLLPTVYLRRVKFHQSIHPTSEYIGKDKQRIKWLNTEWERIMQTDYSII